MTSVMWIDPVDGGYRTGVVVPDAVHVDDMPTGCRSSHRALIRESHNGTLTWVEANRLKPWPKRSERGEE